MLLRSRVNVMCVCACVCVCVRAPCVCPMMEARTPGFRNTQRIYGLCITIRLKKRNASIGLG